MRRRGRAADSARGVAMAPSRGGSYAAWFLATAYGVFFYFLGGVLSTPNPRGRRAGFPQGAIGYRLPAVGCRLSAVGQVDHSFVHYSSKRTSFRATESR